MVTVVPYILFASFFLIDIFIDIKEHVPLTHIWHEVILFLIAMALAIWQLLELLKKNKQISKISAELLAVNKDYLKWKEQSKSSAQEIRGMIDRQLDLWQLSPSEKDVALFLVKGLSMKEIAEIRQTQEKTVRSKLQLFTARPDFLVARNYPLFS